MPQALIRDLTEGDRFEEVLLVREKRTRSNRNGSLYLQLQLDDRSGSVDARYWNVTEAVAESIAAGDFLRIKGKTQLFQGQLQLIVEGMQKCDPAELNVADFLPTTEKSIDGLLADLRRILNDLKNYHLRALAQAFLMDEELMGRFAKAPAGIRNHHAYVGGLLEHVVNLMMVAERTADLFPELDNDLLQMGIFLHDIGKVRELQFDTGFSYSDEGQLLGHLSIGVEMLTERVAVAEQLLGEPIPVEIVRQLKHLILSHHGTYEFGSPKLPMTPEAIALHHLDNLDAKVHNFSRTIDTDPDTDSAWTPYNHSLSRKLYKRSLKAES